MQNATNRRTDCSAARRLASLNECVSKTSDPQAEETRLLRLDCLCHESLHPVKIQTSMEMFSVENVTATPAIAIAFQRFLALPMFSMTVLCECGGCFRAVMYASNMEFVGSIGTTAKPALINARRISRATSRDTSPVVATRSVAQGGRAMISVRAGISANRHLDRLRLGAGNADTIGFAIRHAVRTDVAG